MNLTDDEFTMFRDFISQNMGIYFSDEKRWLLESRLSLLIGQSPFQSFTDYYDHLARKLFLDRALTDPEFIKLIRVITNHETYFYREPSAFGALKKYVLPRLAPQKTNVRILSAGCATGEEVYTITILFLQFRQTRFYLLPSVVGVDLDPHVLEIARAGIYKSTAFRGFEDRQTLHDFKKYFSAHDDNHQEKYRIKDHLKEFVEFHHVNIMDREKLQKMGLFDVIFCRNVLIYFGDDAKKTVINHFADLLAPGGYLFLGHSESIVGKTDMFNIIDSNNQIFYQKV